MQKSGLPIVAQEFDRRKTRGSTGKEEKVKERVFVPIYECFDKFTYSGSLVIGEFLLSQINEVIEKVL